jgi:hypothetical protein
MVSFNDILENMSLQEITEEIQKFKIRIEIQQQISFDVIESLEFENLKEKYYKSRSFLKNKSKFKEILDSAECSEIQTEFILDNIQELIIPAQTKASLRGNEFNKIIKDFLMDLDYLKGSRFTISFEKSNKHSFERPDFTIIEKSSGKVLNGMNQIDLWSGGAQLNRGHKYISSNIKTKNYKLLCVVCEPPSKLTKTIISLMSQGFETKSLCFINGIQKCLVDFFD